MERNEVNTAFELLLKEIERVANQLNETGAGAFRAGDYDKARQAIEKAAWLDDFRKKVKALQLEWADFMGGRLKGREPKSRRTAKGRLGRGLRTPEKAFRRPILEALVELGGRAPVGEVMERVGAKMESVLNEYDRQPMPSQPHLVRWKNTAQWCRNSLVREGVMKDGSPRGIWKISDEGRRWLEGESEK